ncbi:hypothetical protein BJ138DRAFT_1165181, partial [Hygrophoropsis aurantiaca]
MVVFALQTVFALFTFFAVANGNDSDDTCNKRQLILKHGSMLQLFGHTECVIKSTYDHQIIAVVVDDSCVCTPVRYGDGVIREPSIGEKVASLAFDPGMQTPEAVFTLFQGEDCFDRGTGPFTGPFTAIDFSLGDTRMKFAQICSSRKVWERELLKAHKAAEAKAAAQLKHAKSHGTGIEHSLENGVEDLKHGGEKLAAHVKITKTEVEKGLGAVGIG